MRRAILLTHYGQDPFDKLNGEYKTPIELGSDTNDKKLLNAIFSEKTRLLNLIAIFNALSILYKCIVYRLNDKTTSSGGVEDEQYYEMDAKHVLAQLSQDCEDEDEANNNVDLFGDYNLDGLKLKNIFHLWKLFVMIYILKSKNM